MDKKLQLSMLHVAGPASGNSRGGHRAYVILLVSTKVQESFANGSDIGPQCATFSIGGRDYIAAVGLDPFLTGAIAHSYDVYHEYTYPRKPNPEQLKESTASWHHNVEVRMWSISSTAHFSAKCSVSLSTIQQIDEVREAKLRFFLRQIFGRLKGPAAEGACNMSIRICDLGTKGRLSLAVTFTATETVLEYDTADVRIEQRQINNGNRPVTDGILEHSEKGTVAAAETALHRLFAMHSSTNDRSELSTGDHLRAMGITRLEHGLLLVGPPGVGKTSIVRRMADQWNIPVLELDHLKTGDANTADELPERHLMATFRKARQLASQTRPCVIFIDEIDSVCPERANTNATITSTVRRFIAQLLIAMDGLDTSSVTGTKADNGSVLVIAATNRPNAIDAAMRRPGRLDREVVIAPPALEERAQLMYSMIRTTMPHVEVSSEDNDPLSTLRKVSRFLQGFVAADLITLLRRAALRQIVVQARDGPADVTRVSLTQEMLLEEAVNQGGPALLRGYTVLRPSLTTRQFNAGVTHHNPRLQSLLTRLEWTVQQASSTGMPDSGKPNAPLLSLVSTKGILLHGPPGCGKTTFLRALSNVLSVPVLVFDCASVYSAVVGESEHILNDAFRTARYCAPCILALDEIDAIATKRTGGDGASTVTSVANRILGTLLDELDGIRGVKGVITAAATNRLDALDEALIRPGRFDEVLEIGIPELDERENFLQELLRPLIAPAEAASIDVRELAKSCEGQTQAQIAERVTRAKWAALQRLQQRSDDTHESTIAVTAEDLRIALTAPMV
eukprot:Clim_evm39s207 gene=Clim_evmTU39s207